ncbi:hypothetical protein K7432_018433, partial [Basidiobolus ranarum]
DFQTLNRIDGAQHTTKHTYNEDNSAEDQFVPRYSSPSIEFQVEDYWEYEDDLTV